MAGLPTNGPPADAFEGLPRGGVFRRIGGRLVPIDRTIGTAAPPSGAGIPARLPSALPGQDAANPLLHPSPMPPLPGQVQRQYNPLFMQPPQEDAQVKSVILGLQNTLRQAFASMEHALTEAQQGVDYIAATPAAVAVLQSENIDLQQVKDFIATGTAMLDKFAPPVTATTP